MFHFSIEDIINFIVENFSSYHITNILFLLAILYAIVFTSRVIKKIAYKIRIARIRKKKSNAIIHWNDVIK